MKINIYVLRKQLWKITARASIRHDTDLSKRMVIMLVKTTDKFHNFNLKKNEN